MKFHAPRLDDSILGRELRFPHLRTFRAIIAEIDREHQRIRIRSLNTGMLAVEWDSWRDVLRAMAHGHVELV